MTDLDRLRANLCEAATAFQRDGTVVLMHETLCEALEAARHDDSLDMLWFQVGVLTSAVEVVLRRLLEQEVAASELLSDDVHHYVSEIKDMRHP